jgi:8-oxo-dGTP pyrophosphatase MutT (NUDIX family)
MVFKIVSFLLWILRLLHRTVPSVASFVAVFSEDRTKVLLVQHSYNNGKWSLPGGGLELSEDAIATGKRELKEETGLCCAIAWVSLVGTFFLRRSAGIVFLFVGTIVGGRKNGATDETIGCEFVPISSLGAMDVYPAQRAFIRRALAWSPGDPPLYDRP